MARDTDRKIISEAVRRANSSASRWGRVWMKNWTHNDNELTLSLPNGPELNITYGAKGQIVHLVHWQVVPGTNGCASRQPITVRKRERVLEIIGGTS